MRLARLAESIGERFGAMLRGLGVCNICEVLYTCYLPPSCFPASGSLKITIANIH